MGSGRGFDLPQATRQLCYRWKARHVKIKDRGDVSGRQPEGVTTRRVPCEQHDPVPCHATQFGESRRTIVPVVHGQDGEGRVKGCV